VRSDPRNRRASVWASLFLMVFLPSVGRASLAGCNEVMQDVGPSPLLWGITKWMAPRLSRNFDRGQYARAKADYLVRLASNPLPHEGLPKTPEENLAFYSAVLGHRGVEDRVPIESLLGSRRGRRVLGHILKRLDFKRGLTAGQVEDVSTKLFFLSSSNPESLRSLLRGGWSKAVKGSVRLAYEESFARHGVYPAFEAMGLTRDPTLREKVTRFLVKKRLVRESILTTVFALPVMAGATVLPGHIPAVRLRGAKPLPKELYERVEKEGFDSAYPDVKRLYGNRPKFDLMWATARNSYNLLMLAAFARFLYEDYKEGAEQIEGEDSALEQAVNQKREEIGAPEEQGNLLYDAWLKTYREQVGKEPSREEIEDAKTILKLESP
jgi:hypothetical protein